YAEPAVVCVSNRTHGQDVAPLRGPDEGGDVRHASISPSHGRNAVRLNPGRRGRGSLPAGCCFPFHDVTIIQGAATHMKKTTFCASWVTAALAVLAGAADAADSTMDRGALLKLADNYLAALVAHDPRKVPLASDVKVVENVTRIKAGEGLWKTASSAP